MEKKHTVSIWYVLIGIWVVLIIQSYIASMLAVKTIPYSQFMNSLKQGKVTEIAISQGEIQGKMKNAQGALEDFKTVRVDPELSKVLEQYNVTFKGKIESTFLRDIISWVLP
ncbi:MAG TPA: ATP-dependent metallopeptidase FtsH/Yme1/Tma family protein, partial [Deltaproteobacteria bacterium]|nr:ATP-dependent metallopeptidase FtsH/Yme1/Tma family protein [Deltaproteobacteria bacterium]